MTNHLFFLLGFCLLLTHEMDANRCKEWRIFPFTSRMVEETGYLDFTAVHVPLYALLIWGLFGAGEVNGGLIACLDVFFIVHVLLHLLFIDHPNDLFRSAFSWTLILGAGVFGGVDLLVAH